MFNHQKLVLDITDTYPEDVHILTDSVRCPEQEPGINLFLKNIFFLRYQASYLP